MTPSGFPTICHLQYAMAVSLFNTSGTKPGPLVLLKRIACHFMNGLESILPGVPVATSFDMVVD